MAERNIAEIKLLLHHPRRGSHLGAVDKEDGVYRDQQEQKFLVARARQSKANSMLRSRGNSKGASCSPQSVPANSSAQVASHRSRNAENRGHCTKVL